jgi:hypothetical protein
MVDAANKPLSRQDEIQAELAKHGLKMEHSLAVLAGDGHAIMRLDTGEMAEDEDLSPEIYALAEEWTILEGPVDDDFQPAFYRPGLQKSETATAVPDRVVFHVWHDGDSSVGMLGERSMVEIDLRAYGQEDRGDYVEQVRQSLQSSFGELWDTRPKVMTADEIRLSEVGVALLETQDQPTKPTHERELAFTVGTGDRWNCHSSEGMGMSLTPTSGNEAWNWTASREWLVGVGSGQEPTRDEAVAAATKSLIDAGLSLGGLPTRTESGGPAYDEAKARQLLSASLTYIESPEKVDVDWLAASIQRFNQGEPALANGSSAGKGFVLAFPGASDAEGEELVEMLRKGGNTVYRLDAQAAAPVLREVAASAGLDTSDLQP